MKPFITLLLCSLLSLSRTYGVDADPIFKHFYDPTHPLTDISGIDIDRNGMVWVASRTYGLFRFDGYTHTPIEELCPDTRRTPLNGTIHIDSDNRMWILDGERLHCYDCDRNILLPTRFDSLSVSSVHGLGDTLLVTRNDTLYRYADNTLQLLAAPVGRLLGVCDRQYVTVRGEELIAIHPTDGTTQTYPCPIPGYLLLQLQPTPSGEWLLGTYRQGLMRYDPQKRTLKTLIPNDIIRDIEPDEDHYWIASESGLYRYDPTRDTLWHIQKDWSKPYSLSDNAVYAVRSTPEGGVWVGTYFRGLSYLPRHTLDYRYLNPSLTNQTHRGNVVRTLTADGGGILWIGTEDGGVNRYNPRNGAMTNYIRGDSKHTLSGTNVHGVHFYGGDIWVGTFKEGIDLIDPSDGRIARHYDTSTGEGLMDDFVLDFATSSDGTLFVGTSLGVQQYNPQTDRFTTLLSGVGVISMAQDTLGRLWVGTYHGLYRSTPDRTRFTLIDLTASAEQAPTHVVNFVTTDRQHRIWAATENGLYRFQPEQDTFTYYRISDNPLERDVKTVAEDRFGYLWLSTSGGIIRLDPTSRQQMLFPLSDAPCGSRFNYNSVYCDTVNHTITFGSLNGMITFTPQENYPNPNPAKPTLASLAYVDPTDYTVIHQNFTDSTLFHSLPYDRNFLRIGLFSPEIFSAGNVRYAYRIAGYRDDWTPTDRNTIELQNLAPGRYRLEVCTITPEGNFSPTSSFLAFTIAPPLWLTPAAKILYLLAAVGVVVVVFRRFKRRERQKRERLELSLRIRQEQELYESKIAFFTTIAHEIRTPLTLIQAPLDQLAENPTPEQVQQTLPTVMRHTRWLSNLCTQLLDFRSVEKGAYRLNPSMADVGELTREMANDFAPSLQAKGITLKLELNTDSPVSAFIDTDIFHKVVGNLLQNALKYARTTVCIRLRRDNNGIMLSVLNDGHLIQPHERDAVFQLFTRLGHDQPGSGIGLPFARELVRIHGWQLDLLFDTPGLNHFCLTIPHPEPPSAPLTEEEETTARTKPALLVVEDNNELRQFLCTLLSKEYRVIEAADGEEALQQLQQHDVSLVVSDVMMPGISGIELCKRIKTNEATAHLPVVLLTADVTLASKLAALEDGADDYIEKPFSGKYLLARLANILATRRRLYEEFTRKPLTLTGCLSQTNRTEQAFTERLQQLIDHHIDNSELDVDFVAAQLGMSRATLYRKARACMGMSIADFITLCRLKRAAQLLAEGGVTIAEVAYRVGFSSPAYFTTRFSKQFGQTPSEFINSLKNRA